MKKTILFLVMAVALTTQTLFAQVPSYVPTDGLVGYWPFNGNANDESGNGNNGVVNGAALAIDRFGNIDKSYSFDGISNYISINNSSSLNIIGTQITLSFWLYSNNNPNDANYKGISKGGYDVGSGYEFMYRNSLSGDDGVISITGGTGIQACDVGYNMNAAFGQWIHLAVTLNNGVASFYVNGVYQVGNNLNQISQFVSNNSELLFGKRNPLNSNAGFLNGKLDDIGIWNRALTQQEITNMYNGVNYSDTCNAVSGSLTQGLIGYWPFCGNANDDSGNGNNGTVNGATLTTDRFGNSNSAYSFDGNDDVVIPNSTSIETISNSFSISVWSKIDSFNNFGLFPIIDKNNLCPSSSGSTPLFVNGSNSTNGYHYQSINCGTQNMIGIEGESSILNQWVNTVVSYDGISLKIYRNGVLKSSNPYNISVVINSSNLTIGHALFGVPHFAYGLIDDIGIWNRALSQQEITNLYNANQCITNITVTDTLIINVGQLSYNNPATYANNITMAPNPASTQININFNNITNLNGGTLKIINSLGQEVATTPITTSGTNSTMQLETWGGTGMYFVQIINPQGQIVDIKKIILQ